MARDNRRINYRKNKSVNNLSKHCWTLLEASDLSDTIDLCHTRSLTASWKLLVLVLGDRTSQGDLSPIQIIQIFFQLASSRLCTSRKQSSKQHRGIRFVIAKLNVHCILFLPGSCSPARTSQKTPRSLFSKEASLARTPDYCLKSKV